MNMVERIENACDELQEHSSCAFPFQKWKGKLKDEVAQRFTENIGSYIEADKILFAIWYINYIGTCFNNDFIQAYENIEIENSEARTNLAVLTRTL